MDNELLRHDLLYVDEHLTCTHYRADVGTGFVYREFGRGKVSPATMYSVITC